VIPATDLLLTSDQTADSASPFRIKDEPAVGSSSPGEESRVPLPGLQKCSFSVKEEESLVVGCTESVGRRPEGGVVLEGTNPSSISTARLDEKRQLGPAAKSGRRIYSILSR
jgi:hypothetical protein